MMFESPSRQGFATAPGAPAPSAASSATVRQAGAYAIVSNEDGRLLILEAASGRFYLPGGRIESGEDDRTALIREIAEECGWEAAVDAAIARAEQPIMSGLVNLDARYWRARLVAPLPTPGEHRLCWLRPDAAIACLHRPGDRLAVAAFTRPD